MRRDRRTAPPPLSAPAVLVVPFPLSQFPPSIQSLRNATLGSTRVARRAGTQLASAATPNSVRLARYLSGPQAHLKYGVNHSEGAIELYTSCGGT